MYKEKILKIIFASSAFAQCNKVVIGYNGDMPWRGKVRSDMDRFVNLTKGSSLLIGRKTWDSIPPKFRPFDKNLLVDEARQTIVLTKNKDFVVEDPRVLVCNSLEEALEKARTERVWICGGEEIYRLTLSFADEIHQTLVYEKCEGDAFFPEYNINEWKNIYFQHLKIGEPSAEKDKVDSSYLVFTRI